MQSMHHAGYVLAGGRSSRMGRDKALLPVLEKTLVEHVAQIVHQVVGNVTVVGPRARYGHLALDLIEDIHPDMGPLGGIHTALAHSRAEWNLVVACDMPAMTADFLSWLISMTEHSSADAVLPTIDGVRPEPLCAVYRLDCLAAVEKAIENGTLKVTAALAGLKLDMPMARDPRPLLNTNTPAEWRAVPGIAHD